MTSPIVSLAMGMMVARAAGVTAPAAQIRDALPAYLMPTAMGLATTSLLARQDAGTASGGGGVLGPPVPATELVQLPNVVKHAVDDALSHLPEAYFKVVQQPVVVFRDGDVHKVLDQEPRPGLVPVGQVVTLRVGTPADETPTDRLEEIETQQREMQRQLATVQDTLETVSAQLNKLLLSGSGSGPKQGPAGATPT